MYSTWMVEFRMLQKTELSQFRVRSPKSILLAKLFFLCNPNFNVDSITELSYLRLIGNEIARNLSIKQYSAADTKIRKEPV